MISRRAFLWAVARGLLAAPLAAEAQQAGKMYRIGWVGLGSSIRPAYSHAFQDGLRGYGFIVGQNTTIQFRWLGDRLSPAPDIVADFARANVDLIVAFGAPAVLSAKEATQTVPIVMVGARNPVDLGIVASLARPGGNITGIAASVGPEVAGKRLVLLRELAPTRGASGSSLEVGISGNTAVPRRIGEGSISTEHERAAVRHKTGR